MPKQHKESFTRYSPYLAYGLLNAFLWLLLMVIALGMMTGCTASKAPTFQELKELADKDTLKKKIPIAIPLRPDSASFTIIPHLLPIDVPVQAAGKEGRITLTATRRADKSLEISAVQHPDTIRDTIRIEVPVYRFDECKVDSHLSKKEADKLAKAAIREDRQNRNSMVLNIGLIAGAMLLVVILILSLIKRFLP